MTLIEKLSDHKYLIMDAILIISGQFENGLTVSQLQYELLRCGIMIKHPLLKQALTELKESKAIK